jgi:hypothetical protein
VAVAKKPASLPRMAAVKGLSPPKQAIAIRTELPDPHGAVTAQMPVMELPPESVPTVPPAATDAADHPSSFPSSGKMLVFEALPASVDGIVVTPAHVRLAGDENGEQEEQEEREEAEERDSLEATSPRAFEIVEIPGLQKRRWLQVMAVLAVGAFASMFLAGRLSRPKAEPAAPNGPTTSLAMAVTVPEPTEEATPPAPPAPPSAAVAVAEPVAAPAAPSGKGILNTAASTPGRRIFVDDRAVGETPAAVAVPCGVHRVRVGSRGKTMTVDVVCEGEVSVSDR